MSSGRFVFDTNVLVSALLASDSTPARAFGRALAAGVVLVSEEAVRELDDVLGRPKFERYVSRSDRERFVAASLARAELVEVTDEVDACRDSKDNKFLELAVSGRATAVVSGDPDLLDLHPFRGVPILSPATFMERVGVDLSES